MSYKILGKSVNRVDAIAKVTGKAKYAEDYLERCLEVLMHMLR